MSCLMNLDGPPWLSPKFLAPQDPFCTESGFVTFMIAEQVCCLWPMDHEMTL